MGHVGDHSGQVDPTGRSFLCGLGLSNDMAAMHPGIVGDRWADLINTNHNAKRQRQAITTTATTTNNPLGGGNNHHGNDNNIDEDVFETLLRRCWTLTKLHDPEIKKKSQRG
ncbi:hypothetical protein QOT17_023973 [Balamuthia mandrillaris]